MVEKFSAKRRLGNTGEDIACRFLEGKGLTVLERNFLRKWGEIDIIAVRDEVVRFVEVKTVSREIQPQKGSREIDYRPEEHVGHAKLRKLARTAALYMDAKGDRREYQIDVVGVIMDKRRKVARCRHFEQALEDNL
jgi:Holliday junction resolvase-like predicted endonuclease